MSNPNEEVVQCNSQLPRIYQLPLNGDELAVVGGLLLAHESIRKGDVADALGIMSGVSLLEHVQPEITPTILKRLNELVK